MEPLLLVAAALAGVLALAHSYLGERYLLVRLFRREGLPTLLGSTDFTKQTLRFAWHLTSVAWLGFAALLVLLAAYGSPSRRSVAHVVELTFGISGLVALAGSRGRHLSWVVFFAVCGLAWLGSR